MSSDTLLSLQDAGKSYPCVRSPWQVFSAHLFNYQGQAQSAWALKPFSLQIQRGEAIGIVGMNGAGKSTLLQLAAGTLTPSCGKVSTSGRVAALLELGSGLNPEASGRENIHLYGATLGLTGDQTRALEPSILAFSGLGEDADRPVKTYSSGMQVRLAFAVATSVEPDLLIVDEALSVGDGVFAKRSFDRVMQLREKGASLMLCSHSLFHIDLFCDKVLWVHRGEAAAFGLKTDVLARYREFIDAINRGLSPAQALEMAQTPPTDQPASTVLPAFQQATHPELARFRHVQVSVDGLSGTELSARANASALHVRFEVQPSLQEPLPRVALVISSQSGTIISTTISPARSAKQSTSAGLQVIEVTIPQLPLNAGRYRVGVYLMCAQARYVYEWIDPYAHIQVSHEGSEQGPWLMQGQWSE